MMMMSSLFFLLFFCIVCSVSLEFKVSNCFFCFLFFFCVCERDLTSNDKK